MGKMEDVWFVKIGRSDHKYEWLVGSVYMNCEGVCKEENILKLENSKGVVCRALEDGLGIMIGGDMNAHIWELDGCENENGRRMKESMNEITLDDVCIDGMGLMKVVSASLLDIE